jgi:hypothetical protein
MPRKSGTIPNPSGSGVIVGVKVGGERGVMEGRAVGPSVGATDEGVASARSSTRFSLVGPGVGLGGMGTSGIFSATQAAMLKLIRTEMIHTHLCVLMI